MPMTLEEAKKKAYEIYMTQVNMMQSVVTDPDRERSLRNCGHKTLESFLVSTLAHCHKEVDKVFRQYEKENPD